MDFLRQLNCMMSSICTGFLDGIIQWAEVVDKSVIKCTDFLASKLCEESSRFHGCSLCTVLGALILVWYGLHCLRQVCCIICRPRPLSGHRDTRRGGEGTSYSTSRRDRLNQEKLSPPTETEWLNQCIARLWPLLSDVVLTILKENVEPEIQNYMPTWLKLFQFLKVEMGKRPIQVTSVHVCQNDMWEDEIFIDIAIVYKGEVLIQTSSIVGALELSLKEIRGTCRVELKSLTSRFPIVGAVSLTFLTRPHLEYDLTNCVLNGMDLGLGGLLQGYLKSAITGIIDDYIVLPNRYMLAKEVGWDLAR